MSEDNKTEVEKILSALSDLGYKVEKILCAECNIDDVLVVAHNCKFVE